MEEKIRTILAEINEDILGFEGDNLLEEEAIDSFDVMQIIAAFEQEFHIEFDSEDIISENFASVNTITQLVMKTLEESGK